MHAKIQIFTNNVPSPYNHIFRNSYIIFRFAFNLIIIAIMVILTWMPSSYIHGRKLELSIIFGTVVLSGIINLYYLNSYFYYGKYHYILSLLRRGYKILCDHIKKLLSPVLAIYSIIMVRIKS